MADPITHVLAGMAIYPQRPVIGAIAAMASDSMQLAAGIQLTIEEWKETHRFKIVTDIWTNFPPALRKINEDLHTLWYPVAVLLACVFLQWWELVPAICAYLFGHVLLDMPTHDYTTALRPFVDKPLSMGMTFHSIENMKRGTWIVVLTMVVGSLALSIWRGAWS